MGRTVQKQILQLSVEFDIHETLCCLILRIYASEKSEGNLSVSSC